MLMSKRPLAVVLPPLLVCAIVDAWAGRRSYVAGDTVTYMDMASGIAAGNFDFAVNGHFSPLYPALLALSLRLVPSSAIAEFWVVRGVNVLIFVGALALFHVFMSRFLERCDRLAASSSSR